MMRCDSRTSSTRSNGSKHDYLGALLAVVSSSPRSAAAMVEDFRSDFSTATHQFDSQLIPMSLEYYPVRFNAAAIAVYNQITPDSALCSSSTEGVKTGYLRRGSVWYYNF